MAGVRQESIERATLFHDRNANWAFGLNRYDGAGATKTLSEIKGWYFHSVSSLDTVFNISNNLENFWVDDINL